MNREELQYQWLALVNNLVAGPQQVAASVAVEIANVVVDSFNKKFNGENNND